MVLDQIHMDILTRAVRLLGSIGHGDERELPTHYAGILALFARGRNLFRAMSCCYRRAWFTKQ